MTNHPVRSERSRRQSIRKCSRAARDTISQDRAMIESLESRVMLSALPPGTNLLLNGDAELGAASPDGSPVLVPGWTVSGNGTVEAYGRADHPSLTSPGPTDRGSKHFYGGNANAYSSMSQTLGLADYLNGISSGLVQFSLSGWLGG